MKNYYIAIFSLLFSLFAKAQNQSDALFSAQIQGLFIDAPQNFEHFKGLPIIEKDSSSMFTSKMTLPGTTKNEISINKKGSYYTAVIATSLDEKAAAQLGKAWREKMIAIIGKDYEEVPFEANEKKVVRHGSMLIQKDYSVTIHWIKKENEETYTMFLMIMHLN